MSIEEIKKELEIVKEEIDQWRKFAWLNHGCPIFCLYGDDGEMRCNNIHSHKFIDFKRDPIETIMDKIRPDQVFIKDVIQKHLLKEAK